MRSLHYVIELYVFFYTFCEPSVLKIDILRREGHPSPIGVFLILQCQYVTDSFIHSVSLGLAEHFIDLHDGWWRCACG